MHGIYKINLPRITLRKLVAGLPPLDEEVAQAVARIRAVKIDIHGPSEIRT
jgi:hypothetical protein